MILKNKNGDLGYLLKKLLDEKSLSIGRLSKLSNIDKATISRIINNKQKANINHLEKISLVLNVSLERLLDSIGYNIKGNREESENDNSNISIKELVIGEDYNEIESLVKITNHLKDSGLEEIIIKELKKYKDFAKTEEGILFIHENFVRKIENTKGSGIFLENLNEMYKEFCLETTSKEECALIGSALLYFITSTDIIPDFIVPIGFLDDYIAMNLVNSLININKDKEFLDDKLV